MNWKKIKDIALPIVTVLIILSVTTVIIAYGRGYRFDFKQKTVLPIGVFTATSDPTGAQIFIDGVKKSVTNTNINIDPGWYTVTIAKEGYQPWEKKIRVQGEVVARADATLFPSNPSLYAITSYGILAPTRSPDGMKIAYLVPTVEKDATSGAQLIRKEKAGLYVLDLVDKPLGLNRDAKRIILAETIPEIEKAIITWSPDSKQMLIDIPNKDTGFSKLYVLDADKLNDFAKPVSYKEALMKEWDDIRVAKEKEKLLALKEDLLNIATSSMHIIAFSPDETKILYEATATATIPQILKPALIGSNPTEETRTIRPGTLYIYDIKEDRNYPLGETTRYIKDESVIATTKNKKVIPTNYTQLSATIQWLPSSRHLIVVEKDRIDVMEYDGLNRTTVYAGPFWDSFVVPWTNANRLVIVTNLNPKSGGLGTLYVVNIR